MEKIFNNTEVAFALKSDTELERAYFLFKLIESEPLVRIGTAVTNFALKAHLPVEGLIRSTVFDHFCGGVNENDCLTVVDRMFTKGVSSVLDYSVEGKEEEAQFDAALEITLKTIYFAKERLAIPFAVFKPTGFGRFALYEKIGEGKELTETEKAEWNKVVERFDKVCKTAHDLDVALLVDGEETWMQDAADDLVAQMMRKYNKEKAVVYNTLQMYRWDRLDYLKKLHEEAKVEGFHIGMKLVRGAYMEKERQRAHEGNYCEPVHETKENTDKDFNLAVEYAVTNRDSISICVGTHNEYSCKYLAQLMEKNGIDAKDKHFYFAQLLGMSDNISYNLAHAGYNVAKYVPYGPVEAVMPYLFRRAAENTSVAGQASREFTLIKKEMVRRQKR